MGRTFFAKPERSHVVIGAAISLWMLALNIVVNLLELHGWPMFFVTIFFFLTGAEYGKIPSIFLGGLFGLVLALLFHTAVQALAPALGTRFAVYLPLGIILFLIILGGNVCPVLCNNFAFGYYTIACINFSDISIGSILEQSILLIAGGGIALGISIIIKTGLQKA